MTKLNERGFSVPAALILAGVGLAISMGFVGLLTSQFREVKRLEWKISLLGVEGDVKRTLNDGVSCLESFIAPFRIDDAQVGTPGYSIPIAQITESGTAPREVLRQNSPVAGMGGDLTVNSLQAVNIARTQADLYTFDVQAVIAAPSGTVSNLNLGKVVMTTNSGSPLSAKTPASCLVEAGGTGTSSNCRKVTSLSADNAPLRIPCAADEEIISGGGQCYVASGGRIEAIYPLDEVGYLLLSQPYQSGPDSGWDIECFNESGPDTVRSGGYAYCCKK